MTRCPYCNVEVSESAIEAEDGCCPECGAQIGTESTLLDEPDDGDEFLDYENEEGEDVFSDLDDEDEDNAFARSDLDDDDIFTDDLDDEFEDEEFAEEEDDFDEEPDEKR